MLTKQIALLRGINVGRAKRVAMADLKVVMEELGYSEVRTILNSGNVVFLGEDMDKAQAAARIQEELYSKTGVDSKVMVFTADELSEIVENNPLNMESMDASRFIIFFFRNPNLREHIENLMEKDWSPEWLNIGNNCAYIWCNDGIIDSRLVKAAGKITGDEVTSRNWATVMKLYNQVKL